MAHYAFIKDNIVTEVIVGKDEDDTDTLPDGFANWETTYYLTKRTDQDACKELLIILLQTHIVTVVLRFVVITLV